MSEQTTLVDFGSGRWLAAVVVAGRPAVYELSETTPARRLTEGDDANPSVAPDGRTLAFSRLIGDGRRGVWALDLERGVERQLTNPETTDEWPVFLSESNIAFVRASRLRETSTLGQRWTGWDIYLVNARTGSESKLTAMEFRDVRRLSACPDAGAVGLSASSGEKGLRPLVVSLDGRLSWYVSSSDVETAAFTRDCRKAATLVHVGARPNGLYNYELFVIEQDGKRRQVTTIKTRIQSPSWSQDESSILFLVDDDENPRSAWRVKVGGEAQSELKLRLPR